jgi:hypothetical protein
MKFACRLLVLSLVVSDLGVPPGRYFAPANSADCISRTPGPGAGIFQTDSAYRDLDNTYDPGGRLGQLALRFNW